MYLRNPEPPQWDLIPISPPLTGLASLALQVSQYDLIHEFNHMKLANKAYKMHKAGMLSLKKFGLGKLWVVKVWAQNIFIDLLAQLDHSKKIIFLTTDTY